MTIALEKGSGYKIGNSDNQASLKILDDDTPGIVVVNAEITDNYINFDGVNGYVSFNKDIKISGNYTLEGWFKTSSTGNATLLATTDSSYNAHYNLIELHNGKLRFLHRPNAGVSGGTNVYSNNTLNVGGANLAIFESQTGNNPFDNIDLTGAAPTFGDINGDGYIDLVVGNADGNFAFYKNITSLDDPRFSHISGDDNPFKNINVDSNATPFLVDFDRDGDLDLISGGQRTISQNSVGEENNDFTVNLTYYENVGSKTNPLFQVNNAIDGITAAPNSVPFVVDWDQDDKLDLILGQQDGSVNLFRGQDSGYGSPENILSQGLPEDTRRSQTYSAPAFADLDGDGDLDGFIGNSGGIDYYEQFNIVKFAPGETSKTIDFNIIDDQIAEQTETLQGTGLNGKTIIENNETIDVRLYSNKGYRLEEDSYQGIDNYALSFDGVDDYVKIPHHNSLSLSTFTIEAWVNPKEIKNNWQPLITKEANDGSQRSYGLFIVPNTLQIHASTFNDDGVNYNINSQTSLNQNQWNHIAMVYGNSTLKIYINGKLDNTLLDSTLGVTNNTAFQNSHPVKIGKEINAYTAFNGYIDDVRIWDSVRTQAEILDNKDKVINSNEAGLVAYYPANKTNDNTLIDSSGNNNNGNLINGASYSPFESQPTSSVIINDNDTPGLTIIPESGNNTHPDSGYSTTSEDGDSSSFKVKLDTQPISDVIVFLGSQDETEGLITVKTDLKKPTAKEEKNLAVDVLDLGEIQGIYSWENLEIETDTDVDWFKFYIPNNSNVLDFAQINFDHSQGDLRLELFQASDLQNPIDFADTSNNFENISLNDKSFGEYYLKVSGTTNKYELLVVDFAEVQGLTFTPQNWDQEQTFEVKGVDDQLEDGDKSYNIIPTLFSEDPNYQSLEDPNDQSLEDPNDQSLPVNPVTLTNTDDTDQAGFIITGAGQAVEGRENVYSVRLKSKPLGDIRLVATPTNDQIRLNNELVGEPHTLIFTPENWNFDQTVRATALDDSVVEYLHFSEIAFQVETGQGLDFESKADNDVLKNTFTTKDIDSELGNTSNKASDLGKIQGNYSWKNLAIDSDSDEDWFQFELANQGKSGDFVEISFTHEPGDLQLALYEESDLKTPILTSNSSTSTDNQETISLEGQSIGKYYLKVSGKTNSKYDLSISKLVEAIDLGEIKGGYTWNNLAIESLKDADEQVIYTDVDWFKFSIPDTGNDQDFVRIDFDHNSGDLQLELYQEDRRKPNKPLTLIQTSNNSGSTQNFEKISLNDKPFGEYYIKVSGISGATKTNSYDLLVADEDYQFTQVVPENIPVVIEDNDLPTVTIIPGETASEVFGKPSYFAFRINAPVPANSNGLKIKYSLKGGSADLNEDINGNGKLDEKKDRNDNNQLDLGDYNMQTEGFVRIAPGEIQNNLVVVPIDDKLVEDLSLKITKKELVNGNCGLD